MEEKTAPELLPIARSKLGSFHCRPAYLPPDDVAGSQSVLADGGDSAGGGGVEGDGGDEALPEQGGVAKTSLLIQSGAVVVQADAGTELPEDHRLAILMAVTSGVLTMDQALDLSSKVVQAYMAKSTAEVDALMQITKGVPLQPPGGKGRSAKPELPLTNPRVAIGTRQTIGKRLPGGDGERLSILKGVARGDMTIDEALACVQQNAISTLKKR